MRKGLTVIAALCAAASIATPIAIGATNALATSDRTETVAQRVAAAPVEIAPTAVLPASPLTTCRKVRVVYDGYAAASAGRTTGK